MQTESYWSKKTQNDPKKRLTCKKKRIKNIFKVFLDHFLAIFDQKKKKNC